MPLLSSLFYSWNWLLGYNVCVILLKTVLHIVGCVFLQELPTGMCWFVQIFGIGCVRKFDKILEVLYVPESREECRVPREYVGLVWDGLCFGFLIVQRRIFQSYNFFHMINETKATTILASRGEFKLSEYSKYKKCEKISFPLMLIFCLHQNFINYDKVKHKMKFLFFL